MLKYLINKGKSMRLLLKIFLCLCFLSASVFCRFIAALIQPTETSYKMQSMIIDFDPVKKSKDLPESFTVDLTSTVRSLTTGAKNQKILVLRWNKSGQIETKCNGKWTKQDSTPAIDKIIETVKTVIQNSPLPKDSPTDVKLPKDVEKAIDVVLNSLDTEEIPCLRTAT
jgi:hypothetical protein